MPHYPGPDALRLVTLAQSRLGLNQQKLADFLGLSRRTISRWFGGGSGPTNLRLQMLAKAVHPRDPSLAAALAAEGGATLESLGIVAPRPPAPAAVAPPAPPPRPPPPARLLVESIVCVAAEAMQTTPPAVRDMLRLAFARARGLGMTVEEVDDALQAAAAPPPAPPKPRAAAKA